MSFFKFILLPLCIAFSASIVRAAELPDYARDFLNQLPEKSITLPAVITLAAEQSSSFQRIKAGVLMRDASVLQASAPLSWRFEAEGQQVDDESAVNGFGPERTQLINYRLGVSRAFSSGSQLQLELLNVDTDLTFPQNFAAGFSDFIGNTTYSEPRATLSLSQSIWRDGFGSSTRSLLKAADLQKKSVDLELLSNLATWAVELSNLFYQAWLAQAKVSADQANLARQRRLFKIVKVQRRRGTSEKADVLQVESALSLAAQAVADSKQQVNRIFKALVLTIGLPDKWLEVDGTFVPTKIDAPVKQSLDLCMKKWQVVAKENPILRKLKTDLEANEEKLSAAKGQLAPDVRFLFAASANGVQPSFDEAFQDVSQWKNPRYTMGVTLSLPIELKQEKANVLTSLTQKTAKQYELGQVKGDLQAEWVSNCENLNRLQSKISDFQRMMQLQKQRVSLEEKRFRIGKVSVFNVIQAGTDATNAEMSYKTAQVEIRKVAWRIAQMSGEVSKQLLREVNR